MARIALIVEVLQEEGVSQGLEKKHDWQSKQLNLYTHLFLQSFYSKKDCSC